MKTFHSSSHCVETRTVSQPHTLLVSSWKCIFVSCLFYSMCSVWSGAMLWVFFKNMFFWCQYNISSLGCATINSFRIELLGHYTFLPYNHAAANNFVHKFLPTHYFLIEVRSVGQRVWIFLRLFSRHTQIVHGWLCQVSLCESDFFLRLSIQKHFWIW